MYVTLPTSRCALCQFQDFIPYMSYVPNMLLAGGLEAKNRLGRHLKDCPTPSILAQAWVGRVGLKTITIVYRQLLLKGSIPKVAACKLVLTKNDKVRRIGFVEGPNPSWELRASTQAVL